MINGSKRWESTSNEVPNILSLTKDIFAEGWCSNACGGEYGENKRWLDEKEAR